MPPNTVAMRVLRERVIPAFVLAVLGLALPVGTLVALRNTPADLSGTLHFYAVGVASLGAAAAALVLTGVGVRRGEGRTVLIGTAFTVMTGLLSIHGLATPGIVIGANGVIDFTGALTLPVGGAVLALTAVPALRRPQGIRALLVFDVVAFVSIVALGMTGMLIPSLVPSVPAAGSDEAVVALALGFVFYGLLLVRTVKTYLLTRRPADLAVVVGVAWMTASLPPALLKDYSFLIWWIGHFAEIAGILVVGAAAAVDLVYGDAPSYALVGDLKASELVAREEAFLGARVRSLMVRLADQDTSTEEHTRRVALRAVQVGEQLGLPPGQLRTLAIGGLLHDMGKLAVPDRILNKPAALDDDEFAVIKRHPEWGERLLRELGGFGQTVRQLVRSHHERLDGKGYPDGLGERQLSLPTRILAVCDVYDALVSERVYRAAWSEERALEHLRGDVGTAFDERCVQALEQVLAREQAPASASVSALAPATA
jgi:HD-GYP domain-containing protein (c-di-GMP phosphodiesterase class II)